MRAEGFLPQYRDGVSAPDILDLKETNMTTSDPETPRGPMGDARPDSFNPHEQNESGQKPEKLKDRPSESTVTPEDYPEDQRAKGA